MNENKEEREQLLRALSSEFNLPDTIRSELDNESAFFNALKDRLTLVIEQLIFSQNERLMTLLYRIDIPEHRIHQAFDLGEGKKVASRIAELIIERQMQKISYRNSYSK